MVSNSCQISNSSEKTVFPPIPSPWDVETQVRPVVPPHGWMIPPLDTAHELGGAPVREAIAAHGASPRAISNPNALEILLADELRLAHQILPPLREGIGDAIALLELLASQ